jgi:hypothetical protein
MKIAIASTLRRITELEAALADDKKKRKLPEIKKDFIREMKKEPLLERIGPENIWNDLQKYILDEVQRRHKSADEIDERLLQEIKREFIESIKKSLPSMNLSPEELWNRIQNDIRTEIRLRPNEWRLV